MISLHREQWFGKQEIAIKEALLDALKENIKEIEYEVGYNKKSKYISNYFSNYMYKSFFNCQQMTSICVKAQVRYVRLWRRYSSTA